MVEPPFRLAEQDWAAEIERGLREPALGVYVVSPFIKRKSARRLLSRSSSVSLRVVTRFNLNDFDCGASDLDALAELLENGAEIRGIQGLHSKLYVFGDRRSIVTSANFTESGLLRNREFGFISTEQTVVLECKSYCDQLWKIGRHNLKATDLLSWQEMLTKARQSRLPTQEQRLPDFGQRLSESEQVIAGSGAPNVPAFIKFFGSGDNRELRSMEIIEEVVRSGSHWACTYPKRPRQPDDGDTMFMARMVRSPDDYMIFGEAVGRRHVDDQDVASPADLELRQWKKDWPYYIRVHKPRFLNGTLANGVSMSRLMNELGSDAFHVTQLNAKRGTGNTSPRRALMQQPGVRLSLNATVWLRRELDQAYAIYGHIDLTDSRLDWPVG